jgi:spermidine synthase
MQARLDRPEYAPIKKSLQEIGMYSAVDLFSTYAGSADDLAPWLRDAQINRDRNLRLQYLAGRGLNLYQADVIFAQMLPYAGDPKGVFQGSQEVRDTLLARIRSNQGR